MVSESRVNGRRQAMTEEDAAERRRELRRRYEESLRKWEKMTRDQREAIRTSEQLSEADLAVYINVERKAEPE